MMADNHNTNEDEDILVTLDLDDGSQVECEILTIFTVNEQDYIALLPLTEAGEPNEDAVALQQPLFFYRVRASHFPDDREQVFELIEIIDDGDHIVDDGAARRENARHIVQHTANVLERLPCRGLAAAEQHHFVVPDGCILGGHLHLIITHSILSFPLVRSFLFLVQSQRPRGLSSIPSYQIRKAKHVRPCG